MPDKAEVINMCRREDIELVRLLHVDNGGVVRGRVIDAEDVESVMENGVNMAQVMQAFTSMNLPAPGGPFGAVGEARLIPDPETFVVLPYAERTAAMIVDKYTVDRERWDADARTVLGDFLENFSYTPSTSFESEFYLTLETEEGTLEPIDNFGCFTADGMQSAHDVVLDMVDGLKAQDMSLSRYYPEYGPGQQELIVQHTPGMRAPDEQVLYKQTVKSVASNHGMKATFSPKPIPNKPGSGCHMHVSLWDGDENVFYDEGGGQFQISDTCRHFIGGILDHAPALLALTAPSVVSYKRLQPHMWASAFTIWGLDNREAMVRVPSSEWGDPEQTTRIELKAADNTANPYLALLGMLAAGQDGIERELDPGEPVNQDPAGLSAEERIERGIERFPETLGEATEELAKDQVLADAMGETLHEAYLAIKRYEWNEAVSTTTDWDVETYTRQF